MRRNFFFLMISAMLIMTSACGAKQTKPSAEADQVDGKSEMEQESVSEEEITDEAKLDAFYSTSITEGYEDIRNLGENYNKEQAQTDHCFVIGAMVHNDYLYEEFMTHYRNGEDAFIRVAQAGNDGGTAGGTGNTVIYDVLFLAEPEIGNILKQGIIYLGVDLTRDESTGEERRIVSIEEFDGVMEFDDDGRLYWIVYRGPVDEIAIGSENVFVLANIN